MDLPHQTLISIHVPVRSTPPINVPVKLHDECYKTTLRNTDKSD